jgi:hypothetical protein
MLWCSRCSISYLPDVQQVKKSTLFEVPQYKEHQSETLVASIGRDDLDKVKIKKDSVIKGGLKGLKDKGLRITNYEAWNGVGRPYTKKNEYIKGYDYRRNLQTPHILCM